MSNDYDIIRFDYLLFVKKIFTTADAGLVGDSRYNDFGKMTQRLNTMLWVLMKNKSWKADWEDGYVSTLDETWVRCQNNWIIKESLTQYEHLLIRLLGSNLRIILGWLL